MSAFAAPLSARTVELFTGRNDFRLTTESGVWDSTSDRTAQGTIYLTPFKGNVISLYDGTRFRAYTTAEISLALSSLTSGLPYDVYVYANAGVPTLELTAWTNTTTRATAPVLTNGVYLKTGALTRRLVGTIYTTGTGTTADAANQRFVVNVDNRIPRVLRAFDSTSHTYNNTTVRSWNGADLKAEFINPFAITPVPIGGLGFVATTVDGQLSRVGIGMDSTTVISTTLALCEVAGGSVLVGATGVTSSTPNNAGYHYMSVLESGTATGTHTFSAGGVTASWMC